MPALNETFILEKRHADGSLDFSEPQPPFLECTLHQLTDYYFANGGPTTPSEYGNGDTATMEQIRAWYKERGFTWRSKTW